MTGSILRVICEVLAYQGYAQWASRIFPYSALIELGAVTAFAFNIAANFVSRCPRGCKQDHQFRQ